MVVCRIRMYPGAAPHETGNDDLFDLKINLASDPNIEIKPVTDLSDRIHLAQKARCDLKEARLRLEKNTLETIITRNGLLPRLDLFIALHSRQLARGPQ